MPLTRYQIRNEYSLADPELYRAAHRDDPEALLEGVAMAGLVGVLRQLGDLAVFAAEIFHTLHEEVMVTAARGHGLIIRLQQLEAEFPSIETAFLSKTSHSLFLYNAGIDWHRNLGMSQNLITRGVLPRFVMDSYEECLGPPRLFLLDKFDIAGAGACLKRYSDPSLFKAELTFSGAVKAEVPREKKARKIKKKGSHWKNGQTPEIFPTSLAKLHQLFSEERSQSVNDVPAHCVRLKKRQCTESLFDSTTGKSYMEKFLVTHSPECKVVSERFVSPPHLKRIPRNTSELGLGIHEISTGTPAERERSLDASPNRLETVRQPSMDELGEDFIEGQILEKSLEADPDSEDKKIPSTFYKMENQKESAIDGESKTEASDDGYKSDDITSEMDKYMDALTTKESEMETYTDCRPNNGRGFFIIEKQGIDSDTNEEHNELQARFSNSHSVGNSSASDDGKLSVKEGRSSFSYSDTLSNLAVCAPSDGDVTTNVCPSAEISLSEIVDISCDKLSRNGDVLGTEFPDHIVPKAICNEVFEVSDSGEACSNSCITDSTSNPLHLSPRASLSEVQLVGPESTEISPGCMKTSTIGSSNIEDGTNLGGKLPCTIHVYAFPSQMKDDFLPTGSAINKSVEELDGGTPDVAIDALLPLSNVLDLAPNKKNDDSALEEVLPTEYAEDSSSTETLIREKLDSPDSVTFPTEKQLHCLAAQDLEACSGVTSPPECLHASTTPCDLNGVKSDRIVTETDKVIPSTGENSEYLASVIEIPETGPFAEQDFREMTDEVPSLELDSAEVSVPCSEVRTLNNSLEVLSNTSNCEEKDGSTLDMVHLNYLGSVGRDAVSFEFPSDFTKPTAVTEVCLQLDDLVTGTVQAEIVDDDSVVSPNVICSPSRNRIKLQENCFSRSVDSEQNKLEISEASSCEYLIESDAKKGVNQLAVAPTDLNFGLCNPETCDPSGSELLYDVHDSLLGEQSQNDLHLSDGIVAPASSKVSDQESESRSPHQSHLSDSAEHTMSSLAHSLPQPGVPLEQALELEADLLNLKSLHENGESPKSSDLHPEQTQSPKPIDQAGCFDTPSKSCPADPVSKLSESEFSPQLDSHNIEISETVIGPLDSILPSFGLLHEATHQLLLEPPPSRPVLDFSLPDHNALQANLKEMPPLPPIQWRIGKPQHDSLASEGEMVQPSLNAFSPLLPATANEKTQMGFPLLEAEIGQPLDPFFPLSATEDFHPQHGSEMSRGEMVGCSLNPFLSQVSAMVEDEKSQQGFLAFDGKMTEPLSLNPYITLPAVDDGRPQRGSLTLGGGTIQPPLNPFSPLTSIEDLNPRHASLSVQGTVALPLNPLAPRPGIEDEKLQHTSLNPEGKMVNPPNSFSLPTMEDEQPPYDSLTSEGQTAWASNTTAPLADVEDGKANVNRQTGHPRPRDPLIEAVASHDKRKLKKVTERVQPLIEAKVDERDSLLEQIRTKSFNLKPTILTRPNIRGPITNLKVAAILEKANAIRQALGESDEDDDGDSWSDS